MIKDKYILGFMNYCSHDPAACITKVNLENGNIEYIFAEEGFLSRKKKSYQFPLRSIKYCLDYFGIQLKEINRICLDYMDYKRFNRTSDNYRLLVGDFIRANLKISKTTKISFCKSHHLAHAYTAFLPSPFEEAAVVVIDGLGSRQETHSIFKANKNGIDLIAKQCGNGIGELYSLITEKLGFESGEEGKTMGLAPYGENHADQDQYIPSLKSYKKGHICDYSHILLRNPSPKLKINIENPKKKNDIYKPYYSRVAFNLQKECEDSVKYIVNKAVELTECKNICFAGGVALNCVANELISKNLNHNLFVQPASGDTGIPIGLALYGAHLELGNLSKLNLKGKYSISENKKYFFPYIKDDENKINNFINDFDKGLISKLIDSLGEALDLKKVASLLSEEKVGCIYHKGIEIGPRALGHRSFIADARYEKMKEIMNLKIKHREAYRPFAPIIIDKFFNDYFIGEANNLYRYMLGAVKCTEKCIRDTPAIVHVDNTARVQTADKNNGIIYEILNEFYKQTSVPLLINTSFNDNNEPIVFSHQDALLCFLRTNADFLIIDSKIIYRENIKDIENLKKQLVRSQQEWINIYSKSAIEELTNIGKKDKSISLKSFIDFNLKLTNAFKSDLPILELIRFLSNINKKNLYTDIYHNNLLKDLDKIYPSSNLLKDINIIIVEDCLDSLSFISSDDFILLYNLSIYIKKSKGNFYDANSKILDLKNLKSSSTKDIEEILSSYEVNLSKTIDDFFI
tara:strand:- start:2473 stop:4707 length:2235 start_codon:yes stop_codon:yes gene_type:complete